MSNRVFYSIVAVTVVVTLLTVAIIAWFGTRPQPRVEAPTEFTSDTTESNASTASMSECGITEQLYIAAELHHDRDELPATDSATVFLGDSANPEFPISCNASVSIIGQNVNVALSEVAPGRFQAGEGQPFAGAFEQGQTYTLEVDLSEDGSIDATGEVTLSKVEPDDVSVTYQPESNPSQITFSWMDAGDVETTRTNIQISDRESFQGGQFKSGCAEGPGSLEPGSFCSTPNGELVFGGGSQFPFFDDGFSTLYARWQTETNGSLSNATGRLVGWVRYDDAAKCWLASSASASCQL